MAPRIGQRAPEAAGLILLAAPVSFDLNVILRQTRYVASQQGASNAELEALTAPIIAARDTLAHASAAHPPAGLFFHAPAIYWLSLRDYDAVATAQHLSMPMLILQGQRDYQVTPDIDFARWSAALSTDKRVQLKLYPGLDHLFMPGSNPPSPSDYLHASHVDTKVIDDIATWIRDQPATKMPMSR
jgi:pimeloyl-ACP methyl ester carboxylesterase